MKNYFENTVALGNVIYGILCGVAVYIQDYDIIVNEF